MDSLLTRWNDYRNALAHNQDLELHADPFSLVTYGDCEFAFGSTKTTAVTLTRTDQLPGTTTPAE
jgi:hypothetical protein